MIKATIFEDEKAWLLENLPDMEVDGISVIQRISVWNVTGSTRFVDDEENSFLDLTLLDFIRALHLLCTLIDSQKLFVGGVRNAQELTDPCNWDVEVVDAFFQLAFHGEVIYG